MLKDLTEDEKQGAEFMSELSERCYSAGWMSNLEYVLWDAVLSGPRAYGHGCITNDDIATLNQCIDKTSSWIVFDDELEEVSIPLNKWNVKFKLDTAESPERLKG